MGWIPQAKVVQPKSPAANVSEAECFSACDLEATCWVASFFTSNTTCMHFPMASGEDKTVAESKVWWIWEARPGFKLQESGLAGSVQNFTEVVGKVHLEKGVDLPSAAAMAGHRKFAIQSVMSLVVLVLVFVLL
ncbi:hypothetical protein BCR44DRAFT_391720 [Catenaria anguillulae PL171]|uniref:Apple domain-containing protein n=1 Tax=Catenaria anguillulae PL171 TaxID=765915 RepID=A0A1Y2HTZ2_9FUNG|nr:hypothetical protein BCR44DRAFT_391720 [Catenaria anguillulae PL171]